MPSGIQLGAGVRTAAVSRIMSQGDLSSHFQPLRSGDPGFGLLPHRHADGTDAYTRAGNFALSPEGQIVTDKGYTVAPGISVPANATAITVNAQGQVQATIPGQTAAQTLGQLELDRFPNEGGLQATGDNLFTATTFVRQYAAAGRRSRVDRLRHDPAGLSRNRQRQSGGRDHGR